MKELKFKQRLAEGEKLALQMAIQQHSSHKAHIGGGVPEAGVYLRQNKKERQKRVLSYFLALP